MSSSTDTLAAPKRAHRREMIIHAPSVRRLEMVSNFMNLWRYRDMLYTLSIHRIKVRYKQTVLGTLWAILQPLSIMLVFTLVFSLIVRMPSEGVPYAVFAYTALLPWTFFSTALSSAANGLVSHSQLITKVYFPREILPLTYVIAALFDLLIASSILFALILYYRVQLSLNVLYAIPIICVLAIFATAVSLFLSALQVRFRDVGLAMPLVLQLWMYATPVVYPLAAVPSHLREIYALNPMVGIIESFRRVVIHKAAPDFRVLITSALISILLLFVAYAYFKRMETTMADVI
jgi:lipopolysaccharide transport system permease protein